MHPAEWDVALGEHGALRAAVEARAERLVRFIGVTGHGLTVSEMHLRSLERFPFDSVLFPYSHVAMQDQHYASDVGRLLTTCRERNVAVQTIKSISRGPWGFEKQTAGTWYEPLVEQEHIDLAVHWVLGEQGVFLNASATSNFSRASSTPRSIRPASRRHGADHTADRPPPQHPLRLTTRTNHGGASRTLRLLDRPWARSQIRVRSR